jgi:hypothetical protein
MSHKAHLLFIHNTLNPTKEHGFFVTCPVENYVQQPTEVL